jgi:hypothetical protein
MNRPKCPESCLLVYHLYGTFTEYLQKAIKKTMVTGLTLVYNIFI